MPSYDQWIMDRFIEWERGEPRRQSYSAFARYLDVNQSSLSQWIAGSYPPSGENVVKIADRLGYEIYDILEIPQDERPIRKDLREAIRQVPPENQDELLDLIDQFLIDHGYKRL